jgi:hypothetical protein
MARKPNFFIIGAPKCGTTSLATWLAEHPSIFMSSAKELHFFNTEDWRDVETLDHYQSFFRGAGPQHRAVGEASVWYFSSANAVRAILAYEPNARFVVMLRNPVEMAPALHAEMIFTGMESERDFVKAWQLQDERRAGRMLPKSCLVPRRLLYGDICSLGLQLERLLTMVPVQRVLTIVLDDLRRDARREYLRTLEFLDVDDDGRSDFPVQNASQVRRWPFLLKVAQGFVDAKRQFGITKGLGLWTRIDALNTVSQQRKALAPELITALKRYFSADILRLARLLNRSLEEWTA